MTYLEAFLYGAVQGFTEYLPISSSAHLLLFPLFLGEKDPGLTFSVFLHFGTLLSTLIYFWKDWRVFLGTLPVIKNFSPIPESMANRFVLDWKLLVIATIPALLIGGLFHGVIRENLRGVEVVVWSLSLGGVILFLADHFFSQKLDLYKLTQKKALWFGIAQCFAMIPGVSRSGATITAGRAMGFNREESARFSFLMSAPVILAATVFEFRHFEELFSNQIEIGKLLLAGVSAFVFGMIAIGGLLRLLKKFGYLSFAVYRIILAVVIFQMFL